jgi:hypothetical protein
MKQVLEAIAALLVIALLAIAAIIAGVMLTWH